jgi:hypothetical protein
MMHYEQRMEYILNWFRNDMLTRFTPPTGADPKAVATDTVEAVNNNIPSNLSKEQMDNILSSLTKDIVHSARSRTLPIVKDFIASTRKSTAAYRESAGAGVDSKWSLDPFEVAARRIRAGEPVSESFLHGRQRQELKAQTKITDADLDKYLDPTAHTQ